MGRTNSKICDTLYDFTEGNFEWTANYYSEAPAFAAIKIDRHRVAVEMVDSRNRILSKHAVVWNEPKRDGVGWAWAAWLCVVGASLLLNGYLTLRSIRRRRQSPLLHNH